MSVSKRFIVTKNELNDAITYLEYEKLHGFDVKPKGKIPMENMINVEKMVVINPSLIEKLVDKKCKRMLERILKMTSVIYNDDADDDSDNNGLNEILNELNKFRNLIQNKYKEYMSQKEYKLLLKKLEIVENEIKLRKLAINIKQDEKLQTLKDDKKGKGR